MRSYVGITIGPIFDTICDADSPAALWFASSFFSDITRRICKELLDKNNGILDVQIYSPFYSEDINLEDGVGKFHDRIIFSAKPFKNIKLDEIIIKVKKETISCFPDNFKETNKQETYEKFFQTYLQIHYVILPEKKIEKQNCVLVLSPYLDALELMKSFPKNDSVNPIHELNMGKKDSRNILIKDTQLYKNIKKNSNQFIHKDESGNTNIRTINEIATENCVNCKKLKRSHYYAVVSADGDSMTSFLSKMTDNSELVTEFSKICLEYDEKAAELIGNYGGMTIYAGGDDLLFLAPVMTDNSSVFDLCNQIQESFRNKIGQCVKFLSIDESIIPTVSFGISIQYKKYPLYEALKSSRDLLDLAKKDGDFLKKKCKKNNMVIKLQKHSGQSLVLLVGNEKYEAFKNFLTAGVDLDKEHEMLKSVLFTLGNFYSAIEVLNSNVKNEKINLDTYINIVGNLFDNNNQKKAQLYINTITRLYFENLVKVPEPGIIVPKECLTKEMSSKSDTSLQTLLYLLRLKHFLVEEGGEEE